MTCAVKPEDLLLHDAGELDAPEAERVAAHVAGCAECGARLLDFRRVGGVVARGAVREADAARRARVVERASGRRWRPIAWAVAAAAAAILVIAVGRALLVPQPKSEAERWLALHESGVAALGGEPFEFARGPDTGGRVGGAGEPGEETDEERLARARAAMAVFQKRVEFGLLFPKKLPAGMRFRRAQPVDGGVQLVFSGGGASLSVFLAPGSGPEPGRAEAVGGGAVLIGG
ncbi:MAG: hypothetical protein HYY18_03430, partial [Planctomycetes bacterium]|nr:hypothetical protein [Planctomycetota bacterium]